jgi:hypothetical protein
MSSYVLSKKPIIKRALWMSLILFIGAILSHYLLDFPESTRDSFWSMLDAVHFYIGAFAFFVLVASALSLLILKILVTVGFWTK